MGMPMRQDGCHGRAGALNARDRDRQRPGSEAVPFLGARRATAGGQALTLLAEFAPGLALVPVSEDIGSDPPSIRMARLPAEPLAGQVIKTRI
jgi:hypothetical protein